MQPTLEAPGRSAIIKLQHERLRAVLAEMDAEFGPVPARERDRARMAWPERGVAGRKRRRSA